MPGREGFSERGLKPVSKMRAVSRGRSNTGLQDPHLGSSGIQSQNKRGSGKHEKHDGPTE